ncbi:MAG: aldose 1-epimerase [Solirubrobacteraceae bacterium]
MRDDHVLSSDAGGGLEAVYVPSAGMVCASLRHRGEELLGQRGGLERYVAERGTMGISLLHPWANRLSASRVEAGGQTVDATAAGPAAAVDPNGLPIHGLLSAHDGWEVMAADSSRISARFDFAAQPELMAAFPFPHELRMDVALQDATLTVTTTLRATGDRPVPISFGYHPYFALPGVPRADWEIELPVGDHLVVDERMIPTGEREPAQGVESGPLGDRTFDDGYVEVAAGTRFAVSGGDRRIEVTFDEGYPVAVVYAPDNDDVICFEPMTAPPNALCSGDGLQFVQPGETFPAAFSVSLAEAQRSASAPEYSSA